jgi:cytochrome bd ubiquinol oxidase subunit I
VMFSMAMMMATIVAPLQIVAGDLHGLNTLKHQPAKIAAMEGHFETRKGAPLILFGFPDGQAEKVHAAIEIPMLGSYILTHDWNGEVKGLKAWKKEDRPRVEIVFWSFRVMVGIGMAMALIGVWSLIHRIRGRLRDAVWLQRATVAMGPMGFVAVLAGWFVTEAGRQPYTVYGLLRTADSASPLAAPAVATSLAAFIVVYTIVYGAGFFFLVRMMGKTPDDSHSGLDPNLPTRAAGITQVQARPPGRVVGSDPAIGGAR